ncbi:protein dltD precursor [Bacillus toyonensis]|uniref:SAV0927 family protein n=1 Tax=Bacillus toyonensis TaxID=155322 RepID=UPI000BFC403B|nr:SAV0927 family protein [Bacillus toyonensis]PHD53398.1 protein dltD precursor [Bacillus toyonensis]
MKLDILLEEVERQPIGYYCVLLKSHRYDIAVTYSQQFLGKAMVTSIQNGRMILLSQEDIVEEQYWAPRLGIEIEDIEEFQSFFYMILQSQRLEEQY